MKDIKHELQNIIIGNGQNGSTSQLKKVHDFLRGHEKTGSKPEKPKYLKSEEEQLLISFAEKEKLFFSAEISEDLFISEGAEQRVYRFDDHSVIKLNGSHIKNNDYQNTGLGIIFEDLHDENVLCRNGLLYFIDTVFYITPNFYSK